MKSFDIKPLKQKRGSAYKYRLYVNGLAKTCYKTLKDAQEHVAILTYLEINKSEAHNG
jgi:hypothetical protein